MTYLTLLCLHLINTSLQGMPCPQEPHCLTCQKAAWEKQGWTPAPPCVACPWADVSASLTSAFPPGEGSLHGAWHRGLALRSGAPCCDQRAHSQALCKVFAGRWRLAWWFCYFGATSNLERTHSNKTLYFPGQDDNEGRLLGGTSAAIYGHVLPQGTDRHLPGLDGPKGATS